MRLCKAIYALLYTKVFATNCLDAKRTFVNPDIPGGRQWFSLSQSRKIPYLTDPLAKLGHCRDAPCSGKINYSCYNIILSSIGGPDLSPVRRFLPWTARI
jgi:hypothetical protein